MIQQSITNIFSKNLRCCLDIQGQQRYFSHMTISSLCIKNFFAVCIISTFLPHADAVTAEQTGNNKIECYVGQYMARITPAQVRVFTAPAVGYATDLTDTDGRVKKGTVIAKINERDIELERKELEVVLLKEKIDKEDEINKFIREKEELQFILGLPKEERHHLKTDKVVEEGLMQSLDDKIELAKKELQTSREKKLAEFEKKEENFYLKMPFDGQLQYSSTLKPDDNGSAYVDANKEIASVCDDSAFYLMITISSPEITRLPPESFRLVTELGNGETIEGTYSHKKLEKSQGSSSSSETLAFYFKLPEKDHAQAYKMLGVNFVGKLYYLGDEDVIFISKMQLATLPEAALTASWQELLEKVKPDYELVLIGETQIIARKK